MSFLVALTCFIAVALGAAVVAYAFHPERGL